MFMFSGATIIITVVASAITGFIVAKNSARNRYAELFEAVGQKELAQELRDDPPFTPYWSIGGLAGAAVGLVLGGLLPMLLIAWTGLDLYQYRMTVFHFTYGCAILGGIVAAIAGRIVTR